MAFEVTGDFSLALFNWAERILIGSASTPQFKSPTRNTLSENVERSSVHKYNFILLGTSFADSLLLGFIGTRQPAIWMGDWGQVSLQPQLGASTLDYASRGQRITEEQYTPYLSAVEAGGIRTKFSGLEHSAVFEFSTLEHLVINASRKHEGRFSDRSEHLGFVEFSEDGMSVSGWNSDCFDAAHTSPKPNFKGYFYMSFSRPFTKYNCENNAADAVQCSLDFGPSKEALTVKIGLSLISVEQAKANLEKEVGDRDVNAVATLAQVCGCRSNR